MSCKYIYTQKSHMFPKYSRCLYLYTKLLWGSVHWIIILWFIAHFIESVANTSYFFLPLGMMTFSNSPKGTSNTRVSPKEQRMDSIRFPMNWYACKLETVFIFMSVQCMRDLYVLLLTWMMVGHNEAYRGTPHLFQSLNGPLPFG